MKRVDGTGQKTIEAKSLAFLLTESRALVEVWRSKNGSALSFVLSYGTLLDMPALDVH